MNRIYHHWRFWECVKAGMYDSTDKSGRPKEECLDLYASFLRDIRLFRSAMGRVIAEWPISCEQFLTNTSLNRVAWLGQSSACIHFGLPRKYRAGFMLLSDKERRLANRAASNVLDCWARNHNHVEPLFDNMESGGLVAGRAQGGKLAIYMESWRGKGYEDGIPDSAPSELEQERLVPSYRMIARAILENDLNFHGLGFQPFQSHWYKAIKANEFAGNNVRT